MTTVARIRSTAHQVLMFLSSLVILYPLGLIVVGALKDKRGAAQMTYALPEELHLIENVRTVLVSGNVAVGFQNSVIVGAGTTALTIVCAGLAAFVIQRRKSAVTKIVFSALILGIIVPPNVIGQFRLVRALGLYGSLVSVILL